MSTHNGENPDKGTQYDEIISKDYDHNKHLSTQPENMQSKLNESVKPFLTDSNMRVNLKTNRREQPDILFSNQDVNSYASICSFNKHKDVHTKEKPYECNQCDK